MEVVPYYDVPQQVRWLYCVKCGFLAVINKKYTNIQMKFLIVFFRVCINKVLDL